MKNLVGKTHHIMFPPSGGIISMLVSDAGMYLCVFKCVEVCVSVFVCEYLCLCLRYDQDVITSATGNSCYSG